MIKYKQVFLGIILCILLESVFYFLNHKYRFFTPFFSVTSRHTEEHEGGGVLTNPLLECLDVDGQDVIPQINISRYKLNDFVDSLLDSGKVSFMSVYIRDLNNGPWIGINERESFIGGSLLKVPVLIAYMHLVENDPTLLDKKISYDIQTNYDYQYYKPLKEIELGKDYTVDELLKYAIDYSDNNAVDLLINNIDKVEIDKTFESLGLGKPTDGTPYIINAKTYAGFFRVLFNASYLNREYSEKTLETLTHTDFNKGITSLIPTDIVVAHKFGIRTDNGVNQLHDCGIVYYPGHPYLICIMSRGGQFDDLASSIAKVSKFVYDEVKSGLNK